MANQPTNWMPIIGTMQQLDGALIFKGGTTESETGELADLGLFISDEVFTGGTITADITFLNPTPKSTCDIVIYFDPENQHTVNAGLANDSLYSIRHFDKKWNYHATIGASNGIAAGQPYRLKVDVTGSKVTLTVNGVTTLSATLPFTLPQTQVGVFCLDHNDIRVESYSVASARPNAFVVMQFSSPYNDVYSEVIQRICDEVNVAVHRIDEKSGPGLIVSDISRAIIESQFVIADISPVNANVYYEVGFAHALNKPTILLAEKGTKLPFDVSPFRTLFYENTIAGKRQLDEGLRRYIVASLTEKR